MAVRALSPWIALAVLLSPACAAAQAVPVDCGARRVPFVLHLPGFDSAAELLLPRGRPKAVAVLVHGSDVEDLDGSIVVDSAVVSRPLRTIADGLACRGVASVRYDKRFVRGPTTVDREAFAKLRLQDLASDVDTALAATKARPEVSGAPLFLVAWSEGTTVAADVATRRRDLAGVVLVAPVATSFAATLQRQWPKTARPYVERYAKGGAVDAAGLAAAAAGPGGLVPQMYVGFLRGFGAASWINAAIDRDKDGRISLAGEADPTFQGWFADSPTGGLGIYATAVALPGVAAQTARIGAPMLVLQGANDGNVDPEAARHLAADGRGRVTFRLYPGLGHSLGEAASPQEDRFRDPDPKPIGDMAAWILKRVR